MSEQVAVTVLNFLGLILGVFLIFALYNYACFQCKKTLLYFQFINSNVNGLPLVFFFVIIAFFTKENVSKSLQLSMSFLATIFYACTTCLLLYFYFNNYETWRVLTGAVLSLCLTGIHLAAAILILLGKK